jgi:hypothetical protein
MNLGLPKLAAGVALVLCLCGGQATGAESAGLPRDTSAPAIFPTLTNLNPVAPRKDGLKQFEEELTRSLQPFSGKGSLDGIMAPSFAPPPPRPIIINRRPRDESGGLKNWLRDDKEKAGALDPFKSPNPSREGNLRKNSSLDEFFETQKSPRSGLSKDKTSGSGRGRGADDSPLDDAKLPSSLRDSAKTLKQRLFGAESEGSIFNQGSSRSSLSDLFSTEKGGMSRQEIQSHKDYIERFKQMLAGPSQTPAGSAALNNGFPGTSPGARTAGPGGLDAYGAAPRRDAFAAAPGLPNSLANPTAFPDMNAALLNQWNPLYSPPKYEPPARTTLPSSPTFDMPRRRF